MSIKKALSLITTVIISAALIYALISYMGMEGLSFAFALNFLLMACALTFTETLKSKLNAPYFDEKPWEIRGRVYESLGINVFRRLLVLVGWETLNKKSKPLKKYTNALTHLYYRTKQDELGHLIIMIIVLGFNILVAFRFGFLQSLWLLILNVTFNF